MCITNPSLSYRSPFRSLPFFPAFLILFPIWKSHDPISELYDELGNL